MAKKYYAIALTNGTQTICDNWNDAKSIIAACPSNARYKGFLTKQDAQNFLNSVARPVQPETSTSAQDAHTAIAYVDGSYNPTANLWGYGVVLFDKDRPDKKFTFDGNGTEFAQMRNVTGEINAAIRAAREAIAHGYQKIEIYYDYTGIEAWAAGTWKTNNVLTSGYSAAMSELTRQIDIEFHKIAAHTGVELNEMADNIAKNACGIAP